MCTSSCRVSGKSAFHFKTYKKYWKWQDYRIYSSPKFISLLWRCWRAELLDMDGWEKLSHETRFAMLYWCSLYVNMESCALKDHKYFTKSGFRLQQRALAHTSQLVTHHISHLYTKAEAACLTIYNIKCSCWCGEWLVRWDNIEDRSHRIAWAWDERNEWEKKSPETHSARERGNNKIYLFAQHRQAMCLVVSFSWLPLPFPLSSCT